MYGVLAWMISVPTIVVRLKGSQYLDMSVESSMHNAIKRFTTINTYWVASVTGLRLSTARFQM